jgi:hypothetical protein
MWRMIRRRRSAAIRRRFGQRRYQRRRTGSTAHDIIIFTARIIKILKNETKKSMSQ